MSCPKILEIHIDGAWESLEQFILFDCDYVQSIGDLSKLKNLQSLLIHHCAQLRVVKGLDELEFLDFLAVHTCESLDRLIDVSSAKLPNHCYIWMSDCGEEFRGILKFYKPRKRRRLGRWFQCLSFNRLLHCILPCFFPSD